MVMPKEEIASLEMHFLVKELERNLAGGIIKKIYQYGSKENYQFLFEIYKNKENLWLYFDSSTIFLTEYKKASPLEPPSFCMFLRKHLMGSKIRRVSQYRFDRIIEIETESNFLILELFSRGNVILTDSSRKIIMPLEMQRWKDREIKPRIYYKYPPSGINPFGIDLDTFRKIISKEEKTISSVFAVGFGFGKEYAAEICHSAKIDPAKLSKDLTLEQIISIYGILENLDKIQVKPTIYTDFVSVFPMETFANRKPVKENIETISKAFDEYFSPKTLKAQGEKPAKNPEQQEKKMEHILKTQKEAQEKLSKKLDDSKSNADLIYLNYTLVESILSTINKLLKLGKKWPEIKQLIEAEDTPEANAINEIKEHGGTIIISLSGKKFELDINKSVQENAEMYFVDAKKTKSKLEGVKSAIEKGIAKAETIQPADRETPEVKQRKKWYEKFKWFLSSSSMLVIAGRDATQNENIVKKHTEPNDFLFHADIHGAAFVLVKSDGKKIDEVTMKEASEFSAACSKAWIRGIGNVDVYAFRPEQATKPSGSLPKGSFVIQGQRIWFRDMPLKLSVGIQIIRDKNLAKVISGPVMAVRKHSNYFLTIQPGHKDSLELSREIKNKILLKSVPEDRYFIEKIPIGEIQIHIPSGKGEIVE